MSLHTDKIRDILPFGAVEHQAGDAGRILVSSPRSHLRLCFGHDGGHVGLGVDAVQIGNSRETREVDLQGRTELADRHRLSNVLDGIFLGSGESANSRQRDNGARRYDPDHRIPPLVFNQNKHSRWLPSERKPLRVNPRFMDAVARHNSALAFAMLATIVPVLAFFAAAVL